MNLVVSDRKGRSVAVNVETRGKVRVLTEVGSRAILRHALETNDPWLADLVRREDADEGELFGLHSLRRVQRLRNG